MKKLKINKKIISVLLLVFSLIGFGAKAQTSIKLEDAIGLALENNRSIKLEKLKSDYSKTLIKSSNDIPQTNITFDFGQINGPYNDIKLGVSQNIAFPTVYTKQKNVFTEEWKKSLLNVSLREYELKKAVSLTFYNILYWKEKEKLLKESLEFYKTFSEKAALRLKVGESNVLEKTTAFSQKASIEIQLKQLQEEVSNLEYQLKWLLNSDEDFQLSDSKLFNLTLNDEVNNHPLIKMLEQQKNISAEQIALEKAKLLPGLIVAYNLNSFKGDGPNGKTYNATPQFSSFQVGVSLSIFTKAQKSRIEAAKVDKQIAENEIEMTIFNLENKLKNASEIYQSNLDIVAIYEKTELKNAEEITETAKRQFYAGEISYLDFVILVNQAISLKSNYTDAVWRLNQSAIELEYFTINPQ